MAVLLALALVAGVVALNQRGEARDAALAADAQRLGVEALNQERLDRALLFALAAVELDETPDTQSNLLSVLQRTPATLGAVDHGWGIYGAAISPDGKLMAIGDDLGNVVVYDAATRQPLGPPYRIELGLVQDVRFSPDGDTLAISYTKRSELAVGGMFDLIDPRTRERRLRLRLPPIPGPQNFVFTDVRFLPDGRHLLVRPVHGGSPDGPAAPVYLVDRETGAITDRLQVGRYASYFYASETAGGRRVFITSQRDDRTWELDTERLRIVRSWPVGANVGAVSPDGRFFALGSPRGRVRLLDLSSGRIRPLAGTHDVRILRIRFTPDGRTLVTSGTDGHVLAWDVERRAVAQRFAGHTKAVDGLDLTSDGRTLITGSVDTRAILWDLAGDRRLDRRFFAGKPFRVPFAPRGIAVSPDGRTLALAQHDGAVDLIDTASPSRRRVLRGEDPVVSADFRHDGRMLAVSDFGRITLWDTRTLEPAGELTGLEAPSAALAFSPDDRWLAAAEADPLGPLRPQFLRIWDMRSRKRMGFRGRSALGTVAFSPDGTLIAAAVGRQGAHVRDVATGRLVRQLLTGDSPYSVAFSPDGELLFVGQYDGRGQLVSTETWKPVGRQLEGHTGRVLSAEFARDGRTLVTAAADGTARLWDVESQKPLGSPLELAPSTFASVALSPDGGRAFAVSTAGEGVSFNLSREAWKQHACRVAGRELTAAEWDDALPGRSYRTVCRGG
jgi:WD40 repeat protein